MVIQEEVCFEYADKRDTAKGGGCLGEMLTLLTKGVGGVSQLLKITDKWGGWVVQTPPKYC